MIVLSIDLKSKTTDYLLFRYISVRILNVHIIWTTGRSTTFSWRSWLYMTNIRKVPLHTSSLK